MTNTYIIRPVGSKCNLNCDYCYDKKRKSDHSLNQKTLFRIYRKAFLHSYYSNNPNICFIWHGGEPLIWGLKQFEGCINLQKKFINFFKYKAQFNVQNAIQTNGLLLNKEFIQFIKKNNIKIGLSLDGTYNLNKQKNPNKKEYEKIINNFKQINMINKSKNILTTWNLSHIGKENEYLEFIQKEKKIPKINFIDKYHNNEKYLNSIKKLFLLSMKKEIILESFHSLKKDLKNKNSTIKECNLNKCFLDNNIFCFNSDGKIYPCNRLVDKKYCLGDVFNNYSLNYMLNNSMIIKKIKKMRDCCNLSKESVCQGYGCFAEKNKVSCKIFKKLF